MRKQSVLSMVIVSCLVALSIGVVSAQQGENISPTAEGGNAGPESPQLLWSLYPSWCDGGTASLIVPCGDYGVFYLGEEIASNCSAIAGNTESAPGYAPVAVETPFPYQAQTVKSRMLLSKDNFPWIAVVDTGGHHAESVAWLTSRMSQGRVSSAITKLSDSDIAVLGDSLTDFHLVAKLCPLIEAGDNTPTRMPTAVNMSLGRAMHPSDPTNAMCNTDHIACQVAQVMAELVARDMTLVAAAGNQRQLLFPASLDMVIGVGTTDVRRMLDNLQIRPAWEAPQVGVAHFPGQALCLDGWPASYGSSYASAWLSGSLAEILLDDPELDPTGPGIWQSDWDHEAECWGASLDGIRRGGCNTSAEEFLSGIGGGFAEGCWQDIGANSSASTFIEWVPLPPLVPGYSSWFEDIRPTPETDPCVPCVGDESEDEPAALSINTSSTIPLPVNTRVDAVYLRVSNQYFQVRFNSGALDLLGAGELSEILISDAWSMVDQAKSQPSLLFLMTDVATSCLVDSSECYWISTPITLP